MCLGLILSDGFCWLRMGWSARGGRPWPPQARRTSRLPPADAPAGPGRPVDQVDPVGGQPERGLRQNPRLHKPKVTAEARS
jgi:hypothetical protein